jgi:hypothetical protein
MLESGFDILDLSRSTTFLRHHELHQRADVAGETLSELCTCPRMPASSLRSLVEQGFHAQRALGELGNGHVRQTAWVRVKDVRCA